MDTVTDNDTDIEMDTNSAKDMFTDIATDTDMDTVTETDMDKNYQGLGLEGFDSPGVVVNSLWKSAKNRAGVDFYQLASK